MDKLDMKLKDFVGSSTPDQKISVIVTGNNIDHAKYGLNAIPGLDGIYGGEISSVGIQQLADDGNVQFIELDDKMHKL